MSQINKLIQPLYKTLTLQEIDNMIFYDPKEAVARKALKLLWGQGYTIDIVKDEEPQNDLEKKLMKALAKAGFPKVVSRGEFNMSYWGSYILTIYKNEGQELRIGEANPYLPSSIAKIEFADDVSAVVWKRFQWDDVHYTIKEKWDRVSVKRTLMNGSDERVQIQDFNSKVPEELRIKEEWKHQLGILPVSLFTNLEIYTIAPSDLSRLADDYEVRNLPYAINQTYRSEIKEQLLDTTKVFGNFSQATLKKMQKLGFDYSQQLLSQLFIKVPLSNDSNKMVEVSQANLSQLAPLIQARQDSMRAYFNGCGYSYTTGDETLNTNASTLFSKGQDIETTKFKRGLRQQQYSEFIKKFLIAMGEISAEEIDDYDIIFRIKENVVQSPDQIIQSEIAMIEAGLQTRAEALARIRDMDIKEAEAKVEAAMKEQEEVEKKNMEMLQEMSGQDGDGNLIKANENVGEPKKPEVKQ